MAIDPNNRSYCGYNPVTLMAGYEDTWGRRSWKETPETMFARTPEKNDENKGVAALYSGYYDNMRTKASPVIGYEDTWRRRSWKEIPSSKPAREPEKKDENSGVYSRHVNDGIVRSKKIPAARNMSLQERRNGIWFLHRRPAAAMRAASFQERSEEAAGLDKKGITELRMPLCCDGCVHKVQKKLKSLKGVASIECSQETQKVIVRGSADPEDILRIAKTVLPRSTFWEES